jgi:predicted anti-sigma-YlaC factor YlaD
MNAHSHSDQCSSLLGNLSDFIDGELRADLCAKIEEHMKTCENCRIVVDTLKKTVELYEKNSVSAELPFDVKERLFAKLEIKDYLMQ